MSQKERDVNVVVKIPARDYVILKKMADHAVRTVPGQLLMLVYKAIGKVCEDVGVKVPVAHKEAMAQQLPTESSIAPAIQNAVSNAENELEEATCAAQQETFARAKETGIEPKPHIRRVKTISGYRGVHPYGRKWVAKMLVLGKQHTLGPFANKLEAAEAYDRLARSVHGRKALLNFPTEEELGRGGSLDDGFAERLATGVPLTPEEFANFRAKHDRQRILLNDVKVSLLPTGVPCAVSDAEVLAMMTSEAISVEEEDDPLRQELVDLTPAPDVKKLVGVTGERVYTRTGPPRVYRGHIIPPGAPDPREALAQLAQPLTPPTQPVQAPDQPTPQKP